ncbi:MAG: DUF4082 domain-containing protein, partial [Planctomycetota bacterium]
MQQQNPVGVFNAPTTSPSQWGWRFRCNATGVLVTQLGCWFPDSATVQHSVRLYDFSTQQLLATATPSAGTGWRWSNLSSPVALNNGSDYAIQGFTTTFKFFLNTSPASWMPTGTISWVDARYSFTSTPQFPTNTLPTYGSGVVDIGYTTGPPAPAWINYPGTSSGGNYTVSWAPVGGATSYDLEEDNNAGFTSPTNIYSGTATSFNVTNHPPGTFYYRVRARNAQGPGAWCTGGAIIITVPPPPPPSTIIVPATSATGSFTVQWTASAGATQYELQEANNSSFAGATQVYLGANLSYGVTGKTGGTWWYQVR